MAKTEPIGDTYPPLPGEPVYDTQPPSYTQALNPSPQYSSPYTQQAQTAAPKAMSQPQQYPTPAPNPHVHGYAHPGASSHCHNNVTNMNVNYTTPAAAVVAQPQTVIVTNYPVVSHRPDITGQVIFSCFIAWCCFLPLGLAAFILAILAGNESDGQEGYRKLRIANHLNIAGLVTGCCVVILYSALIATV